VGAPPGERRVTEVGESSLLAAAQAGTELDGTADGERSTIEAAVLRRCCHQLASQVDPRGLRLAHVRVTGQLDLAGIAVPFPLRFEDCAFDEPLIVEGADLFELSLTGCELPGLLGNGLRLRRDLDLSRSSITGSLATSASIGRRSAIWLSEAAIGGRLLCIETQIDGLGDRAIQADRLRIGGAARFMNNFTALGEVRLIGAHIDGALELTGAHIIATRGLSLDIEGATVAGSFMIIEGPDARRPVIRGRMDLSSATITGGLYIRNADIEPGTAGELYSSSFKPAAAASSIRARRMTLGGEFALEAGCQVTGGIDMFMSDLGSLSVGSGCTIAAAGSTALELTNSEVRGSITMAAGATVQGTIRLEGAAVHGTLALHGELSEPENKSLISGTGVTVDGDVYLDDLRATGGRLNFRSASFGNFTGTGARLDNPAGLSLSLNQAAVAGSVVLTGGFVSIGTVVLTRCRVAGRLRLSGGSFTGPAQADPADSGTAIEAISAVVSGGMDLGWQTVSPSVDFTDATTTFLADDPANWPARYAISGLTYERFQAPQDSTPRQIWNQQARCAWLNRQAVYDSGPYEQAARVFREHGYSTEAEQILIAQRKHARSVGQSAANWPLSLLDRAYATVGYGYRPWRVLWLIGVLLVLVTASLTLPAAQATLRAASGTGAVYTTGARAAGSSGPAGARSACGGGAVRCFNPELYAIDTVIPLISLDQRSTWYPDSRLPDGTLMTWWLNAATILGWLLSSIFVLSLARLARSS
jgi:hypothetical protein